MNQRHQQVSIIKVKRHATDEYVQGSVALQIHKEGNDAADKLACDAVDNQAVDAMVLVSNQQVEEAAHVQTAWLLALEQRKKFGHQYVIDADSSRVRELGVTATVAHGCTCKPLNRKSMKAPRECRGCSVHELAIGKAELNFIDAVSNGRIPGNQILCSVQAQYKPCFHNRDRVYITLAINSM